MGGAAFCVGIMYGYLHFVLLVLGVFSENSPLLVDVTTTMNRHTPSVVLILVTLIAAIGWLFTKQSLAELPTFAFLGGRFLIASAILFAFCWRDFAPIPVPLLLRGVLVGCAMGMGMMLWICAISTSQQLGVGAFITSLSVVFSPLLARLVFAELFSRATWVAMPIACAGLGMLSLNGGLSLALDQLLFLGAALMLSVHFILNTRFARQLPPLVLTCIQLAVVGCIAMTASVFTESWPPVASISPAIWGWFIASIVIATSLRYLLQTWSQGRMSTASAALIMVLEPIWVALISSSWLGEQMAPMQLLGCGFIFLALVTQRAGGLIWKT